MAKEISTPLLNIKYNGMTWIMQSEYSTPMMNKFVKNLDEIITGHDVRIIKSNKSRTTLSSPFDNGQRVIVKKYHIRGWRENIKYLLLPSRAKVEWEMLYALLARGVSTAIPLAYGKRRRWGVLLYENLIIKEIPDSFTFQTYIKHHCSGTLSKEKILLKRVLLEKLAKFIRHLHEKNIDHRDLHGDNILVTETDSEDLDFHLIDLHKARVCSRLSLRCKADNLARVIDINAPTRLLSRTDCLRFIKYYNSFHDKRDFKRFASRVIKKANFFRNRRRKSSIRWCLKLSTYFAVYKAEGLRIYYRKEYQLADILDLFNRVADQPKTAHSHVLKPSSKAIVFLDEIPFKGNKKKIVVKHVFYRRAFFSTLRGLKFLLRTTFLGTRGRRAWIAGNGFAVKGIPTPQPIALVERKFFGITRDNILLTAYIDDSLSVNEYIAKHFNNELNLEMINKKRLFIEALAKLVRSFHDTGIYHSDLSGRNILVKEKEPGKWEMYIIDLDAVTLWRRLTLRRRLKDLARINVCPDCITNVDRMRFFKTYFHGLPPKAHEYAKRIFELTEVIRRRRSRRHQRKHRGLIHRTRQV